MTEERTDRDLELEGAASLRDDPTLSESDDTSLSDEEQAEAAEIRSEIEETRLEMGGTLNELGDRLEPGHLMNQAKENVREATIGRVEETAKGMSDMVMETIKRNPIPAALAGAGLALLWKNRSNGHDGNSYRGNDYRSYGEWYREQGQYRGGQWQGQGQGVTDKVGEVAGTVGGTVSGAVGTVADTAGQTVGNVANTAGQAVDEVGWRLDRFMQASPLAMGAIALGAGAVAGSIIPETRQEQEFLGDASRQIASTVRDTVDDVASKAEQTLDKTEEKVATESR